MSNSKLRNPNSALYQSQDVVKTKKDFHEALDRNGFHIVPYKSGGCTIDYLKKVRAGKYWCPLYADVKLRSCYTPPKKEIIFKEVTKALKECNLAPFGFTDANKVPAEWLIRCLSTLSPNHDFFQKWYYPEEVVNKSSTGTKVRKLIEDQLVITNDDDFFKDLRQSRNMTAKNTVQLNDVKFSLQLGHIHQQMNLMNSRLSQFDQQFEHKFSKMMSKSQMQSGEQTPRKSNSSSNDLLNQPKVGSKRASPSHPCDESMHNDDSPRVQDENSSAFYNTHRDGKATKKQVTKDLRRRIFEEKPDLKPAAPTPGEDEQIGASSNVGIKLNFTPFTPTPNFNQQA